MLKRLTESRKLEGTEPRVTCASFYLDAGEVADLDDKIGVRRLADARAEYHGASLAVINLETGGTVTLTPDQHSDGDEVA